MLYFKILIFCTLQYISKYRMMDIEMQIHHAVSQYRIICSWNIFFETWITILKFYGKNADVRLLFRSTRLIYVSSKSYYYFGFSLCDYLKLILLAVNRVRGKVSAMNFPNTQSSFESTHVLKRAEGDNLKFKLSNLYVIIVLSHT